MTFRNSLERLWVYIPLRRRSQFALLLILMLIATAAEIFSIGAVIPFLAVIASPDQVFENELVRPIIELLNIQESNQLLMPLTIIFISGAILSGFIRMTLIWLQTRLGYAIGADLSINILRKVLHQPYQVQIEKNSSEIIAGITNKVNSIADGIIIPILIIISTCFILLAVLIISLIVSPAVTLITFSSFIIIYSLIIVFTRKKIVKISKKIGEEQSRVIKILQESLGGIRDVLIDGSQEVYCAAYLNSEKPLRRAQANVHIISNCPRYGVEAFGLTLLGLAALILSNKSGEIILFMPLLGAIALGAQRILPMMQQSYASWTYIRASKAPFEDALQLLEQPLPEYTHQKIDPLKFDNNIRLNNIFFRYDKSGPWTLSSLDLQIKKGSRVGLIGETGSGKSTLTDLLMSLLNPTKGSLEIDGVIVTDHNHRNWQCRIAHVPQSVYLADISIAENIAFGVPSAEINPDRVKEAAWRAQIFDTIQSLPQGYDTHVGERGVKLSGGQRQRIGIARALYKQADVIIFDEATSSLDHETEQAVMNAIESLSKDLTIIVVAHRLSTLKGCDLIVELSGGKIKRKGSYENIVGQAD